MKPHTRALIAVSVYAFVAGRKVAGLYDHASAKHLKIAAEAQGQHLQGFDGDRAVRFGGALPEIYDTGDESFVSTEIGDASATGYDRASATAFTAKIADDVVQLYDHGQRQWFAFTIQTV